MAFRKFRGVEYPVPGIDTAIQVLRPGAKYDLNNSTFLRWEDELGREPPTWGEICRVEKSQERSKHFSNSFQALCHIRAAKISLNLQVQ